MAVQRVTGEEREERKVALTDNAYQFCLCTYTMKKPPIQRLLQSALVAILVYCTVSNKSCREASERESQCTYLPPLAKKHPKLQMPVYHRTHTAVKNFKLTQCYSIGAILYSQWEGFLAVVGGAVP